MVASDTFEICFASGKGVQRFTDHLACRKIDQAFNINPAETRYQRKSRRVQGAVCDYPLGLVLKF